MVPDVTRPAVLSTSLDLAGVVAGLLADGLAVLAQDRDRLEKLFTAPYDSSWEERRNRWVALSRDLVLGNAPISIGMGGPVVEQPMPYLGILMGASNEDPSMTESGLVIDSHNEAPASLYQPGRRITTYGRAYRTQLFVQVWEPLAERAMIIATLARAVLAAWTPTAHRLGLLEATLSDTGFEPSEEMRGRVPFVHVVQLSALHFVGDQHVEPFRRYVKATGTFY